MNSILDKSHGSLTIENVLQISDKDMSLLEERIKRAAKNKPVARVAPASIRQQPSPMTVSPPQVQQSTPPMRREASSNSLDDEKEGCDVANVSAESGSAPAQPQPRPVSGPFGLDMAFIEQIETGAPTHNTPKLIKFDTRYLEESSSPDPFANVNHNVFNTMNSARTS